jgi:DNA-binding GntR family transcriptional regulator
MRASLDAPSYTERPGSRATQVFGELKTRILLGEFAGGARLGEERLAERFGVSRTPVREALFRLHAEGVVIRHRDGGYCPALPDVVVMRELYEVRIGLERQALRRPADHGTRHDVAILEPLRDEWRSLERDLAEPDPDFVLLDEAFHCALAEAAGNAALVEMLRLVNQRIRLVRMQDFLSPARIAVTIEQHLGIVDALLADDVELASERFEHHVAESFEQVADRVALALTRMARLVNGGAA